MMAPAFTAAARNLEPRYRFVKVNTEEQPQLAARFAIRSIPTVVVVRDGKEIARQSGAMDQPTLTRWLAQLGETRRA
jgi:thioredoxin 2